jgi:penicillin-binding protein 2
MARKRKRMQYDPPGQRKRKRRTTWHLRTDQVALSRRTLVMKGGVIAAFGTMAAKLGVMQLQEGERYRKQAEENVIRQVNLPAARGLILDRAGRRLAQNRRSWELRVIPAELPDAESHPEERQRVIDTLVSALQIGDTLVIRRSALRRGSEDTIFNRVAFMLGYEGEDAEVLVDRWKNQIRNEIYLNVTPYAGLSIDDAARFRAAWAELPGVMVMNRLEWLIRNTWEPRLPVIVAQDVPRDVALKLEANEMYLPGVELDDSALVRDYVGGEIMSHVIGYVRPIDAAMIDDPRWKGPNGEQIYEQNDVIGQEGIELAMERELRGKRGRQSVERDASGVFMRIIPGSTEESTAGENVQLTIDLEFQEAVGRALEEQINAAAEAKRRVNEEREREDKNPWAIPQGGSVVAYDPRNGDILAMVSYPYYDNRLLASGISERKWREYTAEGSPQAFLNRATSEAYPPGSTFKMYLAASALDRGSLTPDQSHVCRGAIFVPNTYNYADGVTFACWVGWSGNQHGQLDLYGAIEQSCDVYFYNTAEEFYQPPDAFDPIFYWDYDLLGSGIYNADDKNVFDGLGIGPIHQDMTEKFWFGRATGIEISEVAGLMPSSEWKQRVIGEGWSTADTLNISIGQGDFRATPLQMAFNTGILAANGAVRQPHLVKRLGVQATTPMASPVATPVAETGPVATTEAQADLGIGPEHLEVIKESMRRVVHGENGTARRNSDGSTKWPKTNPEGEEEILIAGKTGTAEFGAPDEDTGIRDSHAWFTCWAPLDEPEIAVAVVIEAGGEGSTFAVPVADSVFRAWFELTGRRPRGEMLDQTPKPV